MNTSDSIVYNPFTPYMNAVLLRHILAAAIRMRGGDRQVDLTQFAEDKLAYCMAGIKDLEYGADKVLPIDEWYDKHWQLFPFGDTWGPLPETHKQLVMAAYTQCRAMSAFYGKEV